MSQLQKRSITLPIFVAYLLSAVTLHFAYIWAASWASRDARLGWFFFHQGCVDLLLMSYKPRMLTTSSPTRVCSRDAWQLNERRLVLSLVHLSLAAWATVKHVLEDRSQVEFDDDSDVSIFSDQSCCFLLTRR